MSIKDIAQRLRKARIAAGYSSARSFALASHISPTTYIQHESAKRSCDIKTLFHYSKLLKVTPAWLLTGEEYNLNSIESCNQNLDNLTLSKKLWKKILQATLAIFITHPSSLSIEELVEFCLELHNNILATSSDCKMQEKMLDLAIQSLKKGIQIHQKEKTFQVA